MKKKLIILLLIVVFVVSPIVVWLIGRSNHVGYSVSAPFAKSVSFPRLKSDKEFYYYSGSSFIKYDLSTQKSTNLSEKLLLPEIYDVRWGDGVVAFVAKDYNAGDNLFPLLLNTGFSTDSNYWWAMSLDDGTLDLIGDADSIGNVVWQTGSKKWVADINPSGDHNKTIILTGSVGDEATVVGEYAEFNSLLWSDTTKFLGLFVNDGVSNVNSYKITNGLIENVYSSALAAGFFINKDGNSFLYTVLLKDHGEDDTGGKLVFKDASEEQKVIDNGYFVGNYAWSNYVNNWVALSADKNSYRGYVFDGKKVKSLGVKLPEEVSSINHLQVGSNFVVLVDAERKAYIAGNDKNFVGQFKTSVDDSQDETLFKRAALKPLVGQNYSVTYFRDENSYHVQIYASPFSKYRDEVLRVIKEDYKLDPNQLDIEWIVGRGVNPGT